MAEATFTFRVEEGLKAAFSEAAKAQDRTGAQLLRGFMRDYVNSLRTREEHEIWFREQVEAGRSAAHRGAVLSAEEVEAQFSARRAETRRSTKNP